MNDLHTKFHPIQIENAEVEQFLLLVGFGWSGWLVKKRSQPLQIFNYPLTPQFSYRHLYFRITVGFFVVSVCQDIYEINAKNLKNI